MRRRPLVEKPEGDAPVRRRKGRAAYGPTNAWQPKLGKTYHKASAEVFAMERIDTLSLLARHNPMFYRQELCPLVTDLRYCGCADTVIARTLGISVGLLIKWLGEHLEFAEAWERGGALADAEVARALFLKAKGFEQQVTKLVTNKKTGETSMLKYMVNTAPDTQAAIFWLTNRQPESWKNTSRQTGPNGSQLPNAPSLSVNFINYSRE